VGEKLQIGIASYDESVNNITVICVVLLMIQPITFMRFTDFVITDEQTSYQIVEIINI
jgi:hypothetical protein